MRCPALLLLICAVIAAAAPPDISQHFNGIQGTFVMLNGRTGEMTRHNATRAATRFPPCSTFKIPNAALLLESGTAPTPEFQLKYDSSLKLREEWAQDHTLRSAYRVSALWYFQEMARRAGIATESRYVRQFNYGNQDTSGGVDRFWINGSLRISADEQVRFLQRLYEGKLGLSEKTTRQVKDIMVAGQGPNWRLSAKTGACRNGSEEVSLWYVGFVERDNNVFYFALQLGDREYDPLMSQRIPKTRAILAGLGILPPIEDKK